MILWLSGTVGAATLTKDEMPSHKHRIAWAQSTAVGSTGLSGASAPAFKENLCENTGGSQSHSHSLSNSTSSTNSLPPYYTLAMIMRCA